MPPQAHNLPSGSSQCRYYSLYRFLSEAFSVQTRSHLHTDCCSTAVLLNECTYALPLFRGFPLSPLRILTDTSLNIADFFSQVLVQRRVLFFWSSMKFAHFVIPRGEG